MTNSQKGYLSALMAVLIWSGFILVSRFGTKSDLSAYDVIAIRYFVCASLLLPIWWFKYRFNLFNFKLLLISLIGGLAYALCVFRGFEMSTASHASLLLPGLMPVFIILMSVIINREVPSIEKWLGIGVITLGVGVLMVQELSMTQRLREGDLWLIAGAFCWSLFSILVKRWGITPWQVTVSLAVITCGLYLPVYFLWLPHTLSDASWPDILIQAFYQGVLATIIQMILYTRAIQLIGPASTGAMMAFVPVFSGVSALIVFDESATRSLVLGLILVSVGAWLSHSRVVNEKLLSFGTQKMKKKSDHP